MTPEEIKEEKESEALRKMFRDAFGYDVPDENIVEFMSKWVQYFTLLYEIHQREQIENGDEVIIEN